MAVTEKSGKLVILALISTAHRKGIQAFIEVYLVMRGHSVSYAMDDKLRTKLICGLCIYFTYFSAFLKDNFLDMTMTNPNNLVNAPTQFCVIAVGIYALPCTHQLILYFLLLLDPRMNPFSSSHKASVSTTTLLLSQSPSFS